MMHPYATKKEAQIALNKARDKAQKAHEAWAELTRANPSTDPLSSTSEQYVARDVANRYYNSCAEQLEEAMHEYAKWDSEDDNA